MKKIYIIKNESNNRFKVGFSKNPESRVKSLQTGNDDIISLYYQREVKHYSKIEALLKRHFSEWRTTGEWFDCDISYAALDDMIVKAEKNFQVLSEEIF